MRRSVAVVAALLTVLGGTAACAPRGDPPTLRVLAGSELADMDRILEGAREATGVDVKLTFSGSLDGAERIAAGSGLDAAWFSSDRYLAFVRATSRVRDRKPIMQSPVVVGVRRSVAARLGWTPPAKVGWNDIAAAAADRRFRFAMSDPTSSNSGFAALVGVATAQGGGRALEPDGIDTAALRSFAGARTLTAATSGELARAYAKRPVDGMVNYESVLIGLNDELDEPLELIYPEEGIFTADYPLVLLDAEKRAAYDKVAAYLRRTDVQDEIMEETARRPVVHGLPPDERFGERLLVEAAFPASLRVVQQLLEPFQPATRTPAHVFYVLDTSGSMHGERMELVKDVMTGLAGLDRTFAGHFTRPPPRERATVILATTEADDTKEFEIDPSGEGGRAELRTYVRGLEADGNTMLWTSVLRAYELAGQAMRADDGFATSVVVLSDGDSTRGITYTTFKRLMRNQRAEVQEIPSSVVLFGDPPTNELTDLARNTGGKVFDAADADLSAVAEEIRGYR